MAVEITSSSDMRYQDSNGKEETIVSGGTLTINESKIIAFVNEVPRSMKNTGSSTVKWMYSGYSFDIPAGGTGHFDKSGRVEFRDVEAPAQTTQPAASLEDGLIRSIPTEFIQTRVPRQ